MRTIVSRLALIALVCLFAAGNARADGLTQTKLVSDRPGMGAQVVDPNLINPWGISFSARSPFWVSNQGAGTERAAESARRHSTACPRPPADSSPRKVPLIVPIPNDGGAPPSDANGPTGQVSTGRAGRHVGATDFQVSGGKAAFIFANLDGSISAWRGGLTSGGHHGADAAAINTPSYTGLAIGNGTINGVSGAYIYAADQNSRHVDIYNPSWAKVGSLTDPNLPAGFTAFNVQNINGVLYVTYAIPNDPLAGSWTNTSTPAGPCSAV